MSVISSTGTTDVKQITMPTSNGNTLYVRGNGTGNYTKIQDAINDSSNGDTVFVYDDSSPYYENVIVNKSIILIGENKDTTIIDGNSSGGVVYISADWVNINGFTIQNSGNDLWDVGVQIISNMSKITGNILIDCYEGIYIGPDDYMEWRTNYGNIITENIIENNKNGITIVASEYNEAYENTIINNSCGILVMPLDIPMKNGCHYQTGFMGYNDIYRNNVTKNSDGIHLFLTGYDNVYENQITENSNGVILEGWYDEGGCNNVYQNNITVNNRGVCIRSMSGGANKNNVYRNNIKHNNEGILIHCIGGFLCGGPRSNNIYQNNIMNNNKGIYIKKQFLTDGPRENNVYQNNFIDNSEYHARDNCKNNWNNGSFGNYWDDWIGFGPKLITGKRGIFGIIPRINFDWHPASEPYDIGV